MQDANGLCDIACTVFPAANESFMLIILPPYVSIVTFIYSTCIPERVEIVTWFVCVKQCVYWFQ